MKSSHKRGIQILGVISVTRAEHLLSEWLNTDLTDLPEDANAWERLFRRYPEISSVPLDSIMPTERDRERHGLVSGKREFDASRKQELLTELADHEITKAYYARFDRFHDQMEMAAEVAGTLRMAWDAPDQRRFEWYTWRAQLDYEWRALEAKHRPELNDLLAEPSDTNIAELKARLGNAAAAVYESQDPPAMATPIEAAIFHLRQNRRRALHCPNPECPAPYFFATKKGQKYCSPECALPSQREAKRRWWHANRAKGGA